MAIVESVSMVSPTQRKQFQQDIETVRAGLPIARLYLDAEVELEHARITLGETRMARLEVGRALKRMHHTKSYRDTYPNWMALCQTLNVSRTDSYRPMNDAELVDSLPQDALSALPDGLSNRQIRRLAESDPEEREDVMYEAADAVEPAGIHNAFARLRRLLGVGDAVPKKPKRVDAAFVKRSAKAMRRWFDARGLDDVVNPLLDAILQHAESAA